MYKCFGGTYCFHLQSYQPISPQDVTTQKTNIGTFTSVRKKDIIRGMEQEDRLLSGRVDTAIHSSVSKREIRGSLGVRKLCLRSQWVE
jgi:hypothetical protein